MPDLIKFWKKHEKDRDRFDIIAFHDDSAKTFAELDKKLVEKGILKEYWGGKNLPFTVLLDSTDTTHKLYQIQSYPTVVLIDPDGNLVKGGDEEYLAKKLAEAEDKK